MTRRWTPGGRERALVARGLSLVQVCALIGGASASWVRRYVPGPLPRNLYLVPARQPVKKPAWTFAVEETDEALDLDALRAAYLRLLLAAPEGPRP